MIGFFTLEEELRELKKGELAFLATRPKLIQAGYISLDSISRSQKGNAIRFFCPALKGVDSSTQEIVSKWIHLLLEYRHSVYIDSDSDVLLVVCLQPTPQRPLYIYPVPPPTILRSAVDSPPHAHQTWLPISLWPRSFHLRNNKVEHNTSHVPIGRNLTLSVYAFWTLKLKEAPMRVLYNTTSYVR